MANNNSDLVVVTVANEKLNLEVNNNEVTKIDEFSGVNRDVEVMRFEEGDVFYIGGSEQRYYRPMKDNNGNVIKRLGKEVGVEWAIVGGFDAAGNQFAKNFIVSSVSKKYYKYSDAGKIEDRKLIETVRSRGDVYNLSKQYAKREDLWKKLAGNVIVVTEVIPIYTLSFAARNKENKTDDDFYTQYCPVFTFLENVENPEDYPAIAKMMNHLRRNAETQTEQTTDDPESIMMNITINIKRNV